MESKEIIESGNKIIAEFMSLKSYEDSRYGALWPDPMGSASSQFNLKYHSSWDWLCPVFDKICNLGYTVQWTITDGATCRIWPYLKTIPSCGVVITDRPFTSVVQFITWYNSQSHSPSKADKQ